MRIKISDIKINPGRRETAPKCVEELARSITTIGLLNPITIDQNNTLIAGLHRLEAAKLLGWTELECTVSGADGLQAELAEINENFVRSGLSHRELGDLLLRRKELYETLHPETRQGKRNGQTSKSDNLTFLENKSFSEDTAGKLGIGKRAVERLVQTARDLTPEAKKIIRDADSKITKGAALKISRHWWFYVTALSALPPFPAWDECAADYKRGLRCPVGYDFEQRFDRQTWAALSGVQ